MKGMQKAREGTVYVCRWLERMHRDEPTVRDVGTMRLTSK
jgi:hypothetical protein